MIYYRVNENGHLITVSEESVTCADWNEKYIGNRYVYTCATNPAIEKVYMPDEVVTFE